ncbi:MAG: SDR family oxidoreductase [Rhodobacteraceae bacterium]|nr:SDR family oxidoreductase [Paracoccaceae bacterium]
MTTETAKTVLITGASSGIGAATAVAAAEAGYDVAITFRTNRAGAEDTAAKVRALGRRAVVIRADLSNPEDIEELFDRIDAEFDELDVLVNNAGIADEICRVEDMTPERLHRMFGVNSIGPFLCARQAAIRMAWRYGGAGGVIVNVSSIAARLGSAGQYVDYAASKSAVDVLTKGLGEEMAADKVRVVGVRPGIIDTEIHAKGGQPNRVAQMANQLPMKRAGTAREVADTILYLMSDKASYITATSVDVAGAR